MRDEPPGEDPAGAPRGARLSAGAAYTPLSAGKWAQHTPLSAGKWARRGPRVGEGLEEGLWRLEDRGVRGLVPLRALPEAQHPARIGQVE